MSETEKTSSFNSRYFDTTGSAPSNNGTLSGKVAVYSDLQARGAVESGKMSGNPIGLDMWLHRIYNQALSQIRTLNDKQKEKINELEVAIVGLSSHNETLEDKILDLQEEQIPQRERKIQEIERESEMEITAKKSAIQELQVEVEKIKGGELSLIGSEVKTGDKIGFILGVTILVCLTLYLVLFYTSVIYNAFILDVVSESLAARMKDKIFTATIVNLEAIPNTFGKHGFLGGAFLILATAVFLGLGYLIYKFNTEKKYWRGVLLYTFTFLFDALLAYEIVKKIHMAEYNSGAVTQPWEFWMFASDIAFWIILFAGFLVYILWGLILSYTIYESDKLQPAKMAINVRKKKIEHLKEDIERLTEMYKKLIGSVKQEIEQFRKEISNIREKTQNNLTAVATKKEEINTIKNTVELPQSEVIDKIKTFAVGWTNHINAAFTGDEKDQMMMACRETIKDFINNLSDNHPKINMNA